MIFLFIVLAAVCKAIADTLQHHFSTSVFKWKDPRWWSPEKSWQYVGFIRFTKYRPDAWHLANSGMIVFFICAACFPFPLPWWALIPLAGTLFNVTFNLFYNRILRLK